MAKPELTQKEMNDFYNEGKTHIWQYNTLYQIDYSRNIGNGEYYLRKIYLHPQKGGGVTRKGRFIAMTPTEAGRYR